MTGKGLNQTDNAIVWANAFMEQTKGENIDHDLMHTWFANAIVTGQDVYRWKNEN